jgi:hypothetical protein
MKEFDFPDYQSTHKSVIMLKRKPKFNMFNSSNEKNRSESKF